MLMDMQIKEIEIEYMQLDLEHAADVVMMGAN